MACIILGFDGQGITATYVADTARTVSVEVNNVKDVRDFVAEHPGIPVMCSSSMDLPGDYTTDKRLIARVRRLSRSLSLGIGGAQRRDVTATVTGRPSRL